MSVTHQKTGFTPHPMPDDEAMLCLGLWLRSIGYRFVTVTPATHARVNARSATSEAKTVRDVFGWSRPFKPSLLPDRTIRWLEQGDALEYCSSGLLRSKVRYSTLGDDLYMHSAWPTIDPSSVFFGPDTYRFTALIQKTLASSVDSSLDCVVDVGCGTGAGGIVAVKMFRSAPSQLVLSDINPEALRYARVNAALAEIMNASFGHGDLLESIDHPIDLLVANPPYLRDPDSRLYRNGGGELGSDLSTRIVIEGLPRLASGGTLILYTGSPIVEGRDTFWESIVHFIRDNNVVYDYTELDPDVFGDELEHPAYARVDRIAAVGLVIRKAGSAQKTITVSSKSRDVPEIIRGEPDGRTGG